MARARTGSLRLLDAPTRNEQRAALERLSPDDMLMFAAVAREGGVRRGALALRMPRSTISRRLTELERAVGGAVVTRSTRRFRVTELGAALLAKCAELEALLESTREVTDRAAREPSGTLSIATSPAIGEELLPPVIEEYARRFPRVRLVVEASAPARRCATSAPGPAPRRTAPSCAPASASSTSPSRASSRPPSPRPRPIW